MGIMCLPNIISNARYATTKHLLRNIKRILPASAYIHTQMNLCSLYEPDYLDSLKPRVPLHGTLNIQIKGYDYTILESYQKLIHNFTESMDIEVDDGWATPPVHLQIQKFKTQSLVVDAEFKMTAYERNIQVVDLPSTVAPILFEVITSTLPEGVELKIHEHEADHEEVRYVPDRELLELKSQLDDLGGATTKKK